MIPDAGSEVFGYACLQNNKGRRGSTVHYPVSIRRRAFTAAAALVVSAVAGRTARAQIRSDDGAVAVAVSGRNAMSCLPLTLAAKLGFFRAEGLDVSLIDCADEAAALRLLATGGAEVASCAFEHTIRLQARGQGIQAFVMQSRVPQVSVGVSTRTLSEFRHPSDLRGRRIGVSAIDSVSQTLVTTLLGRAGLGVAEVSLVSVGVGVDALNALRTGQIDVISTLEPVMTMLEQRGDVKILADTRTLTGTQVQLGGPMPGSSLCAPIDYVQKHPDVCQALASGIVRSLKWLRTAGPGDIIRILPESYLLGDRGLYLMSLARVSESFSFDGLIPPEGPRAALRVLAETDPSIREDRMNLSRTYTNAFARVAKDRFKA